MGPSIPFLLMKHPYARMPSLMFLLVVSASACLSATTLFSQSALVPRLGMAPAEEVVAAMTLEEKAKLVVGMGLIHPAGQSPASIDADTRELVPGCAGTTFGVERLGITRMAFADGPAGLRIKPVRPGDENTYYCTAFPVGSLLASTWDPEIVQKVGEAMGE